MKSLMQCKSQIDDLQQEKALLIRQHQASTQQLRAHIGKLEQDNARLGNEVKRMEALVWKHILTKTTTELSLLFSYKL